LDSTDSEVSLGEPMKQRQVTMVAMSTAVHMGQQRYESEILHAVKRLGPEAGWDVAQRLVSHFRDTTPGVHRYPGRLVHRAPLGVVRAVAMLTYGRPTLVHRLDLRLPAAAGREVITIHDLPPLRFSDEGTLPSSAAEGARRAAGIICPSDFAASEVKELLGVERVWVIPYGLSDLYAGARPCPDADLAGLGIERPFLMHTAGASDRKNLVALAGAWAKLTPQFPKYSLVLCGPPDQRRNGLFDQLPRTRLMGTVSPITVASLMKVASAVVVPSIYEGFGLPALEGMACGTPVIAVRAGALPEVCQDAALLVEPTVEGLTDGIAEVIGSSEAADQLRRKGPRRAAAFTWERAAKAHVEVYDAACGG
jgi:glycosyltransferase involved in cell wall biosynthesis